MKKRILSILLVVLLLAVITPVHAQNEPQTESIIVEAEAVAPITYTFNFTGVKTGTWTCYGGQNAPSVASYYKSIQVGSEFEASTSKTSVTILAAGGYSTYQIEARCYSDISWTTAKASTLYVFGW